VRSALIVAVVILVPSNAVMGYCISHLIGSLVYTIGYYLVFYRAFNDKEVIKKLPLSNMRQMFPSFGSDKLVCLNYKKLTIHNPMKS